LAGAVAKASPDVSDDQADSGKRFTNDSLKAEELATFLGIEAWVFDYEGGFPQCWVEILEEGQNTVNGKPLLKIEEQNRGKESARGKILLFIQRGNIKLYCGSGVTGVGLPDNALWWGWKGFSGITTRLPQKAVTPKAGEEVVLLRQQWFEGNDPAARKVQLLLKAKLSE
jgi:hypothetical protein